MSSLEIARQRLSVAAISLEGRTKVFMSLLGLGDHALVCRQSFEVESAMKELMKAMWAYDAEVERAKNVTH